jgi:hypothetical protein
MKVHLASAVEADAAMTVRDRLDEAGHDVRLGEDEVLPGGAVVVLVSATPDAGLLIPIWERVEVARTAHVRSSAPQSATRQASPPRSPRSRMTVCGSR